jgi:hypothetical protein
MTFRTHALAALLVLGTACAPRADEPQPSTDDVASAPGAPAVLAQANAAKPLIHVWKSPT